MPTEHNGTLHLPKPAGEAPPPPQGVIEIAQRIGETANALALLASQLENAALELTEETEKKLTTVRNLKDLLRGFTSEE